MIFSRMSDLKFAPSSGRVVELCKVQRAVLRTNCDELVFCRRPHERHSLHATVGLNYKQHDSESSFDSICWCVVIEGYADDCGKFKTMAQ